MTKETGGPAFPVFHQNEITGYIPPESAGMTLRDYFAAKAMHGYLSAYEWQSVASPQGTAEAAYRMADEMLKARSK
jgi:hypothetical protein